MSDSVAEPSLQADAAPLPRPQLVVCDGCAAVYRRVPLHEHENARCARCGGTLDRGPGPSLQAQLALALAALVVFAIANLWPIVTLELGHARTDATLIGAVRACWQRGDEGVALVTFATAFVFPLALIALRLHVLVPLAAGRLAPGFALAMQALRWATRWSMVEVFVLATLVTIVRSADVARVTVDAGLGGYALLAVLLTFNQDAGLHRIWRRAAELRR
jgi:paraquat-inducible protein A